MIFGRSRIIFFQALCSPGLDSRQPGSTVYNSSLR